MDVIEITRQLGKAIQADERYTKFVEAKEASETDPTVKDMMDKINSLREDYQKESESETPNEENLQKLDGEFQRVYTSLMVNENMSKYEDRRKELDEMMNYLMQILYLSVNGENPETCEPKPEVNCEGSCSTCGGCN